MKKKGVAMTSQNFEDTINGLKKPEENPVEYVNKSLIKRFTEYVENGYRDGVFGLSRYKHDKGTIVKMTKQMRPLPRLRPSAKEKVISSSSRTPITT